MARKELRIKMTNAGRDEGKTFVITEMPATKGHDWASRFIFAIMNAGIEIPDDIASAGFAGLATLGIPAMAKVPYETAKPMLNELLQQVQFAYDPSNPSMVRNCIGDDFEEIDTIFKLQYSTLSLHMDFFTRAAQ